MGTHLLGLGKYREEDKTRQSEKKVEVKDRTGCGKGGGRGGI